MNLPAYSFHEEQENLILQAAAECIEASSLLDFTMAAISARAGLSMGSIYKHIQSKEDVLVALGHRSQLHLRDVAQRVMALPLPIAARIIAMQLMDAQHSSPYSFGSQLITLLGNEAILRRASRGWIEKYIASDIAVERTFREQLLIAAAAGELSTGGTDPERLVDEICTALWSLSVGHVQVIRQRSARSLAERALRREKDSTIVRAMQRLINAYPWREPLTDKLLEQTCRTLVEQQLRDDCDACGE